MKRSWKFAFTLAEVLVTLGIIGVVASMTMPTLIQNHQKKSYVVQLHKIYNEFQQAFIMKMNETNAVNLAEAGFYRNSGYGIEKEFLNSHFKVVKDCGTVTTDCFASSYTYMGGGKTTPSFSGYKVAIASGAVISFYIDGLDTGTEVTDDYLGYIYVDTNGQKGPNKIGRDMFEMYIYPDGVIDEWHVNVNCRKNNACYNGATSKESREYLYNNYCKKNSYWGCFGKLLNDNWEMNY